MKKQVAYICAVFLLLSMSVITTSILTYPEETKALVQSSYNVSFNQTTYLPNNYTVQIVGVGLEQNALAYVASSINASVGVQQRGKTSSIFKGIRIVHQTRAYGFLGLNGIGRVTNYNLTQDCSYRICTIQKYKSEVATAVYLETGLIAEIMFHDGTYTVTASKNRMVQ